MERLVLGLTALPCLRMDRRLFAGDVIVVDETSCRLTSAVSKAEEAKTAHRLLPVCWYRLPSDSEVATLVGERSFGVDVVF